MKKGRGPPDHRLGERALSLSSASPSIPPPPPPALSYIALVVAHSPLPERLEQANPFASCVLVRELRKKDLFLTLVSW